MSCPRWFPNFIRQITEEGERFALLELFTAQESSSSAALVEEKKQERAWVKEKMQELQAFLEKMLPEGSTARQLKP